RCGNRAAPAIAQSRPPAHMRPNLPSCGKPALMKKTYRQFLRDMWQLAIPYWSSEERWQARGLLALIIAMVLGLVYLNVQINQWNNLFYNALQNKQFDEFLRLMLRFCVLAGIYIFISVFRTYFRQMLYIRWRSWLTRQYSRDWFTNRS